MRALRGAMRDLCVRDGGMGEVRGGRRRREVVGSVRAEGRN